MCFSRQSLSAYVDNELENSELVTVKEHLKICRKCRKEAESFVSIKHHLKKTNLDTDAFTKEAVWARLSHSTSTDKGLDFWHRAFVLSPGLKISLSFIFIAVFGAGIFLALPQNDNLFTKGNNSFDSVKYPMEIPVDNVEKILAYFDINDEPLEVFIQLPGSTDFVIQGEPRFLKKNEYLAGR